MKKQLQMHTVDNYFREIFELKQSFIWGLAAVFFALNGGWSLLVHYFSGSTKVPDALALCGMAFIACLLMALVRFRQAWPVIKIQNKLCSNRLVVETLEDVRQKTLKDPNRSYLGTGYRYGPEHASSMYRIAALPSHRRALTVPPVLKKFIDHNPEITEVLGGEPFLMGLDDEKAITVRHDTWRAHCIIVGLPGTGKTTLLKLIALNKLWSDPNCLLILIDPKNTPELREGLKAELIRQGRPDDFHYFAPANASESCVIDCLANYNRSTEIATRVINTIPAGGSSGEVFRSFCWERVNQIVQAMEYTGEKPTLMRIRYYLREGLVALVEQTLNRYFEVRFGENWQSAIQARFTALSKEPIEAKCQFYTTVLAKDNPEPAVSGIIDQYSQDPNAVRSKTGSLNAVLEQLCSDPLSRLLSPSDHGVMDNDPKVVNLRDLSNSGGVLYMATDGLTDPIISGAISKLASSAVAAASAERYNFGSGKEPQVSFMIDEAHNALNESVLDLLAVGRQSKFELILATQSMPDIVEKTSPATADRVKGLCANTIALRCEDSVTKEFVSEKFNEADINRESTMRSNATHTTEGITEFGGGAGVRVTGEERSLFPPWLVASLPNLQAICSFSNGDKILLRLPVEPREE
ncbi:conjugative transfer system coupling protein TraD [uncultured Photobacterium sp.]|uniref:conjugative transfer system coupling protein TraD n=1 Tax=uncultured Photobacterium sp. TaxID=173973 RepID=UPI0026180248|nr:conjugative transfer system coupling protein TraD [uncultured Photobacterium sp.]